MDYKKSFRLLQLASLTFFVLLLLDLLLQQHWMTILGVLLLLPAGIQAAIFYRCPHCGKLLNARRYTMAKACPRCGRELS